MFKIKVFLFLSLIKNSFCPCARDKAANEFERPSTAYSKEKIARLPEVLDESSGAVMLTDSTFLTLNDGGKPRVYTVDLQGTLLNTTSVPNSSNKDWEEITTDTNGVVYIGDFGNNGNDRKNLRIYKYDPRMKTTDTISFSYLDQAFFPPEKSNRNFDCEAMFHHQDSLYLISKNRGNKSVRFYKLPARPGNYAISPFYTSTIHSMITGASINKDHTEVALLSYGKIYFYSFNAGTLQPASCMGFARNGQAEGISYLHNHSILVTNEQGKVFLLRPKVKKQK